MELAVTGSGVPVSLVPHPSQRFDFLTCVIGQRVDLLCVLQNLCPQLPVHFRFRKLAHFISEPSTGTIFPGQCQVRMGLFKLLVYEFKQSSECVCVFLFVCFSLLCSLGCSFVFHCTAARELPDASEGGRLGACR